MESFVIFSNSPCRAKKFINIRTCTALSLVMFGLFIFFHHDSIYAKASQRVYNHAKVIASSLWTYEKQSPLAYLQLATEANGYMEVIVLDEPGSLFLKIDGPPFDPLEALLRSCRLIPVHDLEAPVEYEGRSIGKIRVSWPCRSIYFYLNVFLCIGLLLVVYGLFLKLLDAKNNLEIRVGERTVALKNEIVERKRAEETQRRQAERLALHVQQTPLGVIEWDLDFHVVQWNKAAEEIFEYSREEALGKDPFTLILPEEEKENIGKVWSRLTSHSGGTRSVNTNRTKSGTIKTCEWYNTPLTTAEGSVFGVASLILDTSKRVQAEQENRQLQGQLLQIQKMEAIGNLAGGVAHDFNNMLGVILGHTEMAMAKIDNMHPLSANLKEIRKAADRSAQITRQLLAFARKQTVMPKVVNLNEVVDGMLNMLRRLIGEDIDLAWLPEPGLWPVKVDPSQIDQMLVNLCINARDALNIEVGKITVETGNTVFDGDYCRRHNGFIPGEYVHISVSDNGCGMDRETLDHIFEPFFTTKAVGEGTGLGMATVYGAVKQNHGFINVYSEPTQGTTVSIFLPRHATETKEARTEDVVRPAVGGSETILLVEDEGSILAMATLMLQQLGYTVLPADTPNGAIDLVKEHGRTIQLIIADVIMPEMNGRDLMRILTSMQPRLKCLFTSGYTGKVIAHHGILDEGINFIQKPFTMKDLADKIREILAGK